MDSYDYYMSIQNEQLSCCQKIIRLIIGLTIIALIGYPFFIIIYGIFYEKSLCVITHHMSEEYWCIINGSVLIFTTLCTCIFMKKGKRGKILIKPLILAYLFLIGWIIFGYLEFIIRDKCYHETIKYMLVFVFADSYHIIISILFNYVSLKE